MADKPDHSNPSQEATEKPTLITELPEPILADVLFLVPIKTILDCKRLCKSFHSINTKDDRFYPLHFSRDPELLLCTPSLEKMILVDPDSEGDIAREINLSLENMEAMNSCRGLLCLRPLSSRERIYILNPFTLEFIVLPNLVLPVSQRYARVAEWVGLGYSPSTNEYKVLSVTEYENLSSGKECFVVDILTLGETASWRRLKGLKPNLELNVCFSTFLNGSLHWVMNECDAKRDYNFMTYFDLENETFGYILLPAPFDLSEDSDRDVVRVLSLVAFEGMLTLCVLNEERSLGVWVMKEYHDPASWYNSITVDVIPHFVPERIRSFFPVKCVSRSKSTERVMIYFLDNVLVTFEHQLEYWDSKILKKYKFSTGRVPLSKVFMHVPILMSFKKLVAGATVVHSLRPTKRKVWRRRIDEDEDEDDENDDAEDEDEDEDEDEEENEDEDEDDENDDAEDEDDDEDDDEGVDEDDDDDDGWEISTIQEST